MPEFNMTLPTSSRLIVKNLPKTVTETKLRELFSTKGSVTDVQLKYTAEGKFRSFAFIGFKTPNEAEEATNYFNNTFIGATKINVEPCVKLGDPTKPKAWSKHASEKASGAVKRKTESKAEDSPDPKKKDKKKTKEAEILEKCKEDPDFLEFLETHRQKTAWGNDTIVDELEKLGAKSGELKTDKRKGDVESDEDSEIVPETLETSKHNKKESKKKKVAEIDSGIDEDNQKKSKKKQKKGGNKSVESKLEVKTVKKVPEKTYFTLKLRDLPKKAKKQDIKSFFAPIVPKSIRLPPKFRGIAYVGFASKDDQRKALSKNKSFLLGNRILLKKHEQLEQAQSSDVKKSKWAAQEENLQKESETVSESGRIFIRNLSYLTNEDEIRDLFEPFGTVTEVHLPIDRLTRKIKGFAFVSFFMPEHAAKAFTELDGTIFQGRMLHLLPAKVKDEPVEDPENSFKKNKELKQKKTASSSYNWNTLFLSQNTLTEVVSERYGISREELLLDGKTDEGSNKDSSVAVRLALAESEIVDETKKFLESQGVSLAAFENKKTERSKVCILVKNLNSKTTAQSLVELFSKHGEIGRLVMPPSGVTAIVEFTEPAEARGAFKNLAYTKFQGLPLYLEWAPVDTFEKAYVKSNKVTPPPPTPKLLENVAKTLPSLEDVVRSLSMPETEKPELQEKDLGTKLLVRNVPFQATLDEVKSLFSTFGTLKACRLPKKSDGSGQHRGFAFIDFNSQHEAKRAFETIGKSTHLYGRRLVLEWAAKNETVSELRMKTAKQFQHQVAGEKESAQTSTKKLITRYFHTKSTKSKSDDEDEED